MSSHMFGQAAHLCAAGRRLVLVEDEFDRVEEAFIAPPPPSSRG